MTALEQKRERYQRRLETYAVGCLCAIMAIATLALWDAPPGNIFQRFMEDIGAWLTPRLFAVSFLLSMLVAPMLLIERVRRLDVTVRRWLFVFSAAPLITYTFPIGYYALRVGMGGLSAVIFVILFIIFSVLALAVYRE